MGRKNKHKSLKHEECAAFSNKKKVELLIQKLLNLCVMPTDSTNEWSNYIAISDVVERIRQFQIPLVTDNSLRIQNLDAFKSWIEKHSSIMNKVDIKKTTEHGLGVFAIAEISSGDLLTSVPQNIILTADLAMQSKYFSNFAKSQSILMKMLNVRLALYLHCEKYIGNSFFDPYIKVLPNKYDTTLYFEKENIKLLQNTPAYSQAIYQFKSIARQYALFFNLFHTESSRQNVEAVEKIPIEARNAFTFDAYRWAVSTVTTRQNIIPLPNTNNMQDVQSESFTLGLIPMWDMFNHSNGDITTDYDTEAQHCKSFAMKDFERDEEVTICYGKRSNSEFLIHNGFVPTKNPFDSIDVHLGISQNDSLYHKKICLLSKLNISGNTKFWIYFQNKIPADMLAFVRVFLMNSEQLDFFISQEMPDDLKKQICTQGDIDDKKVWSFLEARMSLLTSQKSAILNKQPKEQDNHATLVYTLQNEYKKILQNCKLYCASHL